MHCGRNIEINSNKRAKSRTSQRLKAAPVHPSSGSRISIPSTEEPASVQCFARNPPMNPEAPVIITFMLVDPRSQKRFRQPRRLPEYLVRSDSALQCRYQRIYPDV